MGVQLYLVNGWASISPGIAFTNYGPLTPESAAVFLQKMGQPSWG